MIHRRPPAIAVVAALAALACLDTSNVARTDQPPELLALEDSLSAEHFNGLVVVEVPREGVLRLRFRDPARCRAPVTSLDSFAVDAAVRALALRRAPRFQRARPISRVEVSATRTHRFGVLVWTTALGRFSFDVARLDTTSKRVGGGVPCETARPPQLLPPHG